MPTVQARQVLQELWGFPDFIPPQEEIIESILSGKDTLALLPTGGGKSLCYQLPALMHEGITLVISPLMALIKDQIQQLHQKGIKAIYLSSEQSFIGQIDVIDYVLEEDCKLLYISPERLQNRVFIESLKRLKISTLAVDEAHCVSEWGNDFRPSYLHIKKCKEVLGHPPTIALTASATPQIQENIIEKLGLENPNIFKSSFARENLQLHIRETENKYQQLVRVLEKHHGSTIIYARTRKETENIARQLRSHSYQTDFFHAGLPEKEKIKKQGAWMRDELPILVATNAFGMGINKANVRLIVHYNLPYSIENYYQEIGRAGRDQLPAHAYLIYNEFDIHQTYNEFRGSNLSKKEYQTISQKLFNRWEWAKNSLPENPIEFDFHSFGTDYKLPMQKVKTLLRYFHNSGILYWNSNRNKSTIQFLFSPHFIDELHGFERTILESLSRNISGIFQDKVYFQEKHWAKTLQIAQNELHDYLLKWREQEWILYEDGGLHSIRFLQAREDRHIQGKLFHIFQTNQRHRLLKLKNLFYLVRNNNECRMNLLLRYFGESTDTSCGHCDVCESLKKRPQQHLESKVYDYIQKEARSLPQILAEFHDYSTEDIVGALQILISENKVYNLNFQTYAVRS